MTTINYNGSKWAGDSPDSIDTLIERLETYALNPTFENYGNFALNLTWSECDAWCLPRGTIRFWGNFFELSAVFSIDTNDSDVIERLLSAIRANQHTAAYRIARTDTTKGAAQNSHLSGRRSAGACRHTRVHNG